ncbi:histidine phosphatase family protein [Schaalia suimastitidis]|uniref:histidine phosphatase family protein n=1 Tax=Schaalia suimastitidis TaxID=121163 RepID=UPI000421534C|nr:histidine phosphatase family protein [Schaalia suimastitidis]
MKLVLIRHGRTSANVSGALDTHWPGLPLDAEGCRQADDLAVRWTREVAAAPDFLLVSPLRRTRMTAEPLVRRLDIPWRIACGIREIRAGDTEMCPGVVHGRMYHGTVARWIQGDWGYRMPGGENGYEVLTRVIAELHSGIDEATRRSPTAARGHVNDDAVLAVVMHGALIRFLTASLCQGDVATHVQSHFMDNTGTTVIELGADLVRACRETQDPHPVAVSPLISACNLVTWNDSAR